jgi:hypothetical protein
LRFKLCLLAPTPDKRFKWFSKSAQIMVICIYVQEIFRSLNSGKFFLVMHVRRAAWAVFAS